MRTNIESIKCLGTKMKERRAQMPLQGLQEIGKDCFLSRGFWADLKSHPCLHKYLSSLKMIMDDLKV